MTAHPHTLRASSRTEGALATAGMSIAVSIVLCTIMLMVRPIKGFWPTFALLWLVFLVGAVMIARTARKTRDTRIFNLLHVHAVKLVLMFALLHVGWIPTLDQTLPTYGYDPQRYYFEAEALRASGFDTSALPSLKYTAILYLYGLLFAVTGHNPFAPALVNHLILLFATLAVIRTAYALKPERWPNDWTLGLVLLIPEMIWYDCLVSRETMAASTVAVAIIGGSAHLLAGIKRDAASVSLWMALPAMAVLGVVRTSALAAVFAAILAIYFLHRMTMKQRLITFIAVGIIGAMLFVAPKILSMIGSYEFTYMQELDPRERARAALDETVYTYSENSVGKLLIADTWTGLILRAPFRIMAYIVLPLGSLWVSSEGLAAGEWRDWQLMMMQLSSLIYIFLLPYAMAFAVDILRKRMPRGSNIFMIAFLVVFAGIAIGNQILHERYRIMSLLLFAACLWFGRMSGRKTIGMMYMLWFSVLGIGVVSYVTLKLIL